ncbi:PadR family transcriptional regulator [Nocardia sp. XZ_19_369]|uniref:PadR family transcriptional regulator n=1 Tax=Nocardia sp. XZ_19_369 TaxID=2769487 RepID=UPI001E4B93DE|nr:PadR family transcriptional regulator [Nocardia sp. XZ_19_369]
MTTSVATVLREFLGDPNERRYGFDLMQSCGLASGSLYPILARLETAGWIEGQREELDPAQEGRPARKYYQLTTKGRAEATRELAALSARFQLPDWTLNPRLAWGGTA